MRPPTSAYRHWSGRTVQRTMPETEIFVDVENNIVQYTYTPHPLFQFLGSAPVPRNRWEWFWHDWHHGRLMKFDVLSVLWFCISAFNRNNIGRVEASEEARHAARFSNR